MAAPTFRTEVLDWLRANSPFDPVLDASDWHDFSAVPERLDPPTLAVQFLPGDEQLVTIGQREHGFRETGSFSLIIMADVGAAAKAALVMGETLRRKLRARRFGRTFILGIPAFADLPSGSVDGRFRLFFAPVAYSQDICTEGA
jgi:hypothetical protein